MSNLYLPWGSSDRYGNRLQARNQFASSLELHNQCSYEYQEPRQRQRSPSLPPIHHSDQQLLKEDNRRNKEVLNRNISTSKRFAFYDEDGEGDTSGYGSETVNPRNGALDAATHNPVLAWQQNSGENRNQLSSSRSDVAWSGHSPRGNTAEEGRPKWGDRGVATGRLWEPTAPTARLPQMPNQSKGTPAWVERGLNMIENTADVLVIDQRSTATSGFDCDSNGSDEGRTFLRGQNVPLEPEIKAQRENKRIKALELQSAILSQLEDREKRRQEERERKLREERLEELRIQQQHEEDKRRVEQEKRKHQEKQLLEQRKLETLKKALEDAETKAKQEKEKRYTILKNISQTNLTNESNTKPKINKIDDLTDRNENVSSPTKTNRTYNLHSAKNEKVKENEFNSHQTTEFSSPRSAPSGNLNLFIQNVPPLALNENQYNIVPIGINGDMMNTPNTGIQLAVLLPQNLNSSLYSVSLNSLNNPNDATETEKVLTPRKYRTTRSIRNVSTQTDTSIFNYSSFDKTNTVDDMQRAVDKNYSNIDEDAPQDNNTSKKDRRFRSEERYKKDIENRPKWGVNRPAAQYKKQSEKDPFYTQKRKLRHKYRSQARQYLSQSSEDSRSPSPPIRSERIQEESVKQRNSMSQSYWKNKKSGQDFFKSNATDNDNVIPHSVSLSQITNDTNCDFKKSPTNSKLSPSKRLTLSQKFINDKYGNRKLWIDENTKPTFDTENRKKIIDHINSAKKEYFDRSDENYLSKI